MVERGRGQLVFVASFAGKVPSAGESSIYTATKFGLRGFAHVLRAQMKRKQVGVSLVTPGPVRDAGMFARGGGKPPPLIGTSSPEDVGKAVVKRDRAQRRGDRRRVARAARDVEARRARARDDRRPLALNARATIGTGRSADVFEHGAARGAAPLPASPATPSARSPRWSMRARTAIPCRPPAR